MIHIEVVKTTAGKQIQDFVNVKNVAKAVITLTEANYTLYEIYNICSYNPVSVRDFILENINIYNFNHSFIDLGGILYRDNEAMVFVCNNEKLQNAINYPFSKNHKSDALDIYTLLYS